MRRGNLSRDLPQRAAGESIELLARGAGVEVERLVSWGHASAPGFWYDQERPEWVALVAGRARLAFAGPDETVELAAGDWIEIPAHRRHRVEWTDPDEPAVWLAIHFPA